MPLEFNLRERRKYIDGWLTKRLSSAVKDTLYTLYVKVNVVNVNILYVVKPSDISG